jgi:SAM-dependent methyltransferase
VIRDTDRDWVKLAEEKPYWAVVSDDRFLGKEIGRADRTAFFRSGEQLVQQAFSVIGTYFIRNFAPTRALDFGCGVGRTLIPIAQRSKEAVGVDVAPNMLELSRRHLREAKIENARAVFPDDPLMKGPASFDFIHSYIVLQHIPPERGYGIFQDLLRLLRPGGIAALHLTYAIDRNLLVHAAASCRYFHRDGDMLIGIGPLGRDLPEGTVQMFDYDLNHIMLLVAEGGIGPTLILPTKHSGHIGVLMYLMKAG